MFEVKDKNNHTLYMHDKISYEFTTEHGDEKKEQGIIISFPKETQVQYQPIEAGLPVICESLNVIQLDSLAQRIMSLKKDDNFQALVKEAGERYLLEVATGKKKKSGKKAMQAGIDQTVLNALAGMKKK